MKVHTGTVKWFNDPKGWGFITTESGKDVFVHYSHIQMEGHTTLTPGQTVLYTMQETVKGLQAVQVWPEGGEV